MKVGHHESCGVCHRSPCVCSASETMTKPTTESGAPIEFTRGHFRCKLVSQAYAELAAPMDATAADLVAALQANPELRAQALRRFGTPSDQLGALTERVLAVSDAAQRAEAAETELAKWRVLARQFMASADALESFANGDDVGARCAASHAGEVGLYHCRTEEPCLACRVRVRFAKYAAELTKCRAELEEYRTEHDKVVRLWKQTAVDWDGAEKDAARGWGEVYGLMAEHGRTRVELAKCRAELERAGERNDNLVARAVSAELAFNTLRAAVMSSGLRWPVRVVQALLASPFGPSAKPATGDQEAAAVNFGAPELHIMGEPVVAPHATTAEPTPPEAPKLPGGLGPDYVTRAELVELLRTCQGSAYNPYRWFEDLADAVEERGRQR